MDIILLERVTKLGLMGDVVTVKDGYARNFLLPQKKALRATESNKKVFENQRVELEARNVEMKAEAEKIALTLVDVKVVLIRQAGESGHLYGSATTRDIAEAVTNAGVSINRSQVILAHPIKSIGLVDVSIKLHPEVSETVVVNIARSEEEAETQFETGAAVTGEKTEDEYVFEPGGFDDDEDEASEKVEAKASEDTTEESSDDATEEASDKDEVSE